MSSYVVDDLIPSAYFPFIKCSLTEEDRLGQILIAICTCNGQLLEFSNKKLINGCEIDCSDAKKMYHFIAYNPFQKYYLIQTSSEVIIVKRQKELKVYKTFQDVLSVEVKDLLRLGRPQIIMEMHGKEATIVTDLVGTLETSKRPVVQSQISLNLHSKLQEASLRLLKAKSLLQEKRNCRMNAMVQFPGHFREKVSSYEECEQVTVLGSAQRKNKLWSTLPPNLEVGSPWQRIYCCNWIIGVPVHNSSVRKIHNIHLILNPGDETALQYKTHFFVFPQVNEPGVRWTEILPKPPLFESSTELCGGTSGTVICVLDEPIFQNSNAIKLSGVVVYKEDNTESCTSEGCYQQVQFSSVKLKVSDLVQGSLRSFSSTTSNDIECDLLSCIVVCNCTKLEVQMMHPNLQTLEEKLEENLGFVRLLSLDYFVCKQPGSLEGVIVKVERTAPWQYTSSVHTSEEKKTLLFMHSLYDVLPQHAKINRIEVSTSTIQDVLKSLDNELLVLMNTLLKFNTKELPLSDTSAIQLPEDSWTELKNQLFKQELKTDKLFKNLPVEKSSKMAFL